MSIIPILFLVVVFFVLAVGMTPSLLDVVLKFIPESLISKPVVATVWVVLIGAPGLFALGVSSGVVMADNWSVVDDKGTCTSPDSYMSNFKDFTESVSSTSSVTDFKSWGCDAKATDETASSFTMDCSEVETIGTKFTLNHGACE